jgi:hypothetical protein
MAQAVDDGRESSSSAFMFYLAPGLSRSLKLTSVPQVIGQAMKSKRDGAWECILTAVHYMVQKD